MVKRRHLIYHGQVVQLYRQDLPGPDGTELQVEVVRHPGGAAVAALDDQGRVCMLHQFRHAIGEWLWELPAGKRSHGEPPLTTAQRELEEETGVRADDWTSLGEAVTAPGFSDEVIHLFLARDLRYGPASPDAHEHLAVHWLPWPEALQAALQGRIRDAKTIVALCRIGSVAENNRLPESK